MLWGLESEAFLGKGTGIKIMRKSFVQLSSFGVVDGGRNILIEHQ